MPLSQGPWGAGPSRLSPLPALRAQRNWFLKETRAEPGSVVRTLDTSVNGEATPLSHVLLEERGALGSLALGVPSVRGPSSQGERELADDPLEVPLPSAFLPPQGEEPGPGFCTGDGQLFRPPWARWTVRPGLVLVTSLMTSEASQLGLSLWKRQTLEGPVDKFPTEGARGLLRPSSGCEVHVGRAPPGSTPGTGQSNAEWGRTLSSLSLPRPRASCA